MANHLVIVESPAKAKTISKILGPSYTVMSSVGHVRDLPQRRIGVDLEHDFKPQYEVVKGKAPLIASLRAAADAAESIFLAPDPDREGEAIAWHLRELLARDAEDPRFVRVSYNEITPRAVREAFSRPGAIVQPRVDAQQARRVLDRIVGYRVSPLLWRQIQRGLSAGRVQSVALRMVVEREHQISSFQPEPYWVMGARVRRRQPPPDVFEMRLSRVDGKPISIHDADTAAAVLQELDGTSLRVRGVRARPVTKRPPPPFITSTVQQAASNAYGFSPGRTMTLAQRLYEGVEMGDGPVGLITYMRTDSVAVSADAAASARDFIRQKFGTEYVPASPNVYRERTGAQGAHEAIRPTDVQREPNQLRDVLEAPALKLYTLIWRRFVASQMAPAQLNQRTADAVPVLSAGGSLDRYAFSATASDVVFEGFMKVHPEERKPEATLDDTDAIERLPPLETGEMLDCLEWLSDRKETKPPPRFSEASLVRALEAKGIGRPSTYAGIVETLGQRKYVQRVKRVLFPTDLGVQVGELLTSKLNALFDVGFTANMESLLDRVENGEMTWTAMLHDFYRQFQQWLDAAREPAADTRQAEGTLALLTQVRDWAPERKQGRRIFGDQRFVTSVEAQLQERKKAISIRQLEALLRLLCRYRQQVPGAEEWIRSLDRADLLENADLLPPRDQTFLKFAVLKDAELTERDREFFESLRRQVEAGRRLSEAQLRVLDQLVAAFLAKTADDPARRCAELGVDPALCVVDQESGRWIEALLQFAQWREPTRRGKKVFDDKAFVESLDAQYRQRGSLSPRQRSALRRMVMRYKNQIPDGEKLLQQDNSETGAATTSESSAPADEAS